MNDISALYGSSPLAVGRAADRQVRTGGQGSFQEDLLALREAQQTAAADEEPDLIEQVADPGSDFYQSMFQRLRLQLEQSEEEKKKQAVIDTLDAILEGMRSIDGGGKRKNMASSMAGLSRQISELDADDPRRAQLDLFRQRLNQLGIFVDLDLGVKGSKDKGGQTLTEYLIDEENKDFDPGIFDLI